MGVLHMEQSSELFQLKMQVPVRIQPALVTLLEAVSYAEQTSGDYWEFAVELESLLALGLTRNDFRWLVRNGLVEHKREVTLESDNGRAFRPTGDLVFPMGTCFVLTKKGIGISSQSSNTAKTNASNSSNIATGAQIDMNSASDGLTNGKYVTESVSPCWDSGRRVLTLNGMIVKNFKWAAENQEAILSVFEEEGWPYRIDDPLKPCPEQDSKRRLSDTIKCLNRKQSNALIHFRGDGTGEGVVSELANLNGANCSPHD